jgi:glycosyltransferase involved in cell wall biosynthesis
MIHVVHVGPSPEARGGIATVISQIVAQQKTDPELDVGLIPTMRSGSKSLKARVFLKAIVALFLRCLRAPRPILHVHVSMGMSLVRKGFLMQMAGWLGVPSILHVHASALDLWYQEGSPRRRRWIRRQFQRAKCVIAVSEFWREFLSGITDVPVEIVHNSLDVKSFSLDRANPDRNVLTLLFLGLVGDRKGTFDLLRVFQRLTAEAKPLPMRLVIAGDGEVERARQFVAENGLADAVEVIGWIGPEEKRRRLRDADIFVLPTHHEGLPMALLEAVASGLPVISTPVGGIPEVVRDNETGLLVPPGDEEALAGAIRRLVSDRELRRRLAANGYAAVVDKFDTEIAAQRLKTIYKRLIEEVGDTR